jgi:hypothetical protein
MIRAISLAALLCAALPAAHAGVPARGFTAPAPRRDKL